MKRIGQNQLSHLVCLINDRTKSPKHTYTKGKDGQYTGNIGNYHLDWAYGGVQLCQLVNPAGGVRVISTDGFGTKRQLHSWMQAFLSGLETSQS